MTDMTNTPDTGNSSLSISEAAEALGPVLANMDRSPEEEATPIDTTPEASEVDDTPDVEEEATEDSPEASEATEEQPEDALPDTDSDDDGQDLFLVDGEEVKASQVEEWKKDGLRQSDYTRKAQELAQQRETQQAELQAQEAALAAKWEEKMALFADNAVSELEQFQATDWDRLEVEEPVEYATQWANYQRAEKRAIIAEQEIRTQLAVKQQEADTQRQSYVLEQAELAKQAIPDLNDPEKGPALIKDMSSYMNELGFSKDEIDNTLDARALSIIKDAMEYRKLKSDDVKTKKTVKKTKVLRSGNSTPDSLSREKAVKARSSAIAQHKADGGSVEDTARLLGRLGF